MKVSGTSHKASYRRTYLRDVYMCARCRQVKLWGEGKGWSLLKAWLTYFGLLGPMPFYRSGLQKYCTNESRNKSCKKSMKPQRYWTKDDGVVFMSTEGEGATVLKGHHQQQFSFRDPPLLWVFSWICCFKNFTIGKIRFMNARIQLVHHHTTLMLHHIFELLHKHLHLQNSIKILSSNNH